MLPVSLFAVKPAFLLATFDNDLGGAWLVHRRIAREPDINRETHFFS